MYELGYYAVLVVAGIGLLVTGRFFPTQKLQAEYVAKGMRMQKMRTLNKFIRQPWKCVYRQEGLCVFAELICDADRIVLPDFRIPDGSVVNFTEYIGATWHPDTPYLGGLERDLQMTVTWSEEIDTGHQR